MSGPHRWFLVLTSYFLLTLLSARQLDAQTDAGSYVFGGKRGAAWVDSDGLNILADFESAPGALQPLELRPDVNIAPIIFSRHPYTYYVEPRDPLWQDGIPRIFRGFGHHLHIGLLVQQVAQASADVLLIVAYEDPGGHAAILSCYESFRYQSQC